MCKTYVATEPIYRTYCGGYPLSPDFKAFSVSFSLSVVETKGKGEGNDEGIRLHVLLNLFSIFFT